MACCPAHDDRNPSLSIREAEDRVLIHCFAGCPPADVLAAIGLELADLYERPLDHHARPLRPKPRRPDPLDVDRAVVAMARAEIAAGRPLVLGDRARLDVAIRRLKEAKR